jgi:peptidoglycan/xylan/chitin deacetylase (PgdA/CDA1 family)
MVTTGASYDFERIRARRRIGSVAARAARTVPRSSRITLEHLRIHSSRTWPRFEHAAQEMLGWPTRDSVNMQFACLTYHGIGNAQNQYTISEQTLRAQLGFLREEGYTAEGFEGLHHRLSSGQDLPVRYVVLSFDDGYTSAMLAADCLDEYGFTATFFLTRDRCQSKPGFIRLHQIRQLRQRGFSLGTHGTTHRKLTRIPEWECRDELAQSRAWLEDVIAGPVHFTAVPGGFINALVMRLAAEQNYRMIATCRECMNSVPRSQQGLQAINRVNVRSHFSATGFRSIVEGNPSFYWRRQMRSAALWLPKQLLRA